MSMTQEGLIGETPGRGNYKAKCLGGHNRMTVLHMLEKSRNTWLQWSGQVKKVVEENKIIQMEACWKAVYNGVLFLQDVKSPKNLSNHSV